MESTELRNRLSIDTKLVNFLLQLVLDTFQTQSKPGQTQHLAARKADHSENMISMNILETVGFIDELMH